MKEHNAFCSFSGSKTNAMGRERGVRHGSLALVAACAAGACGGAGILSFIAPRRGRHDLAYETLEN